jgi:uncharacterized protein YbjQ (UPF0145 family)
VGFFTSGLSVKEFALLRSLGPQPLAQVRGASVVRAGWQYLPALAAGSRDSYPRRRGSLTSWHNAPPPGRTNAFTMRYTEASVRQVFAYAWHAEVVCQLEELTGAWNMVRRQALARLAEEADTVGADAVVGVRMSRSDHNLGLRTIEYVVTGTAIRDPELTRPPSGQPVITDLSVQDYWRLRQAGFEPRGLGAFTAVVFASAPITRRITRARTAYRNQELSELSAGFQLARADVRRVLTEQVSALDASTLVGVELLHEVHKDRLDVASSLGSPDRRGWHAGRLGIPYYVSGRADATRDGWVITMHGTGTAISRRQASSVTPQTQIRMGGAR